MSLFNRMMTGTGVLVPCLMVAFYMATTVAFASSSVTTPTQEGGYASHNMLYRTEPKGATYTLIQYRQQGHIMQSLHKRVSPTLGITEYTAKETNCTTHQQRDVASSDESIAQR